MESRGSERTRSLKRKPLADLTNAASSLSSSISTRSLLKPIPKPRPKPPQSSNPDEPSARSSSGFNSTGHEDNGGQNVATSSPKSIETFLDSVDDAAQHDKSNHSIVYARQTAEGRRCKEKEAGRRKWKEKEARMYKGKATRSTALSCPPVARTTSMKGKLVMEDDKFDHPKAFSVPYPEAKKKQRCTLPEDFMEKQRAYFAEIDAFELSEEVVSESELE
ncbi:hypothetical protein COCNU_04G004210 [Cocos nucifera]|uniref:Sororin C-terminal region domain-containing protein n=1 Tax=Cocos nucifera TaxID=13894 RepID=A0A8K0I567_COCNU|nr:hypothetical protein COCNU_04G004210 [Cocos nucifera]